MGTQSGTKLDQLVNILKEAPDEVFIQPHNVPDPDAIASCLALYYLLTYRGIKKVRIVYDQEIEKANALKMVELFDVPIIHSRDADTLGEEDWTVLVDVQKGNSNVTDLITDEVAVIDHHEHLKGQDYRFSDIRPEVGSCSAIMAEYFFENNITIPSNVATALLYGIFMDTNDLTRGTSSMDIEMFYKLYPRADISFIIELRGNAISYSDLSLYAEAFKTVEVYDGIGFLKLVSANDSLLGAAGDIVLSVSGVDIVVAYSERNNGVKLSIRSSIDKVKANTLVRFLVKDVGVGGGHEHMAGGFIPADNLKINQSINTFLKHRAISFYESI